MRGRKLAWIILSFALLLSIHTPVKAETHKIKMVVFDYDGTISDNKPARTISPKNAVAFKELLQFLKEKDIYVGIATYGTSPLYHLNPALGEDNPFNDKNIYTPSRIAPFWKDGSLPDEEWDLNKNTMLEQLQINYSNKHNGQILNNSEVLFIEDNKDNYIRAKEAGYLVYLVDPPCKGMKAIAPGIKKIIMDLDPPCAEVNSTALDNNEHEESSRAFKKRSYCSIL